MCFRLDRGLAGSISKRGWLSLVDIATVPKRDYDYEKHVIFDRVDDPIVAYAYPPCWTATQGPGSWRTGILS